MSPRPTPAPRKPATRGMVPGLRRACHSRRIGKPRRRPCRPRRRRAPSGVPRPSATAAPAGRPVPGVRPAWARRARSSPGTPGRAPRRAPKATLPICQQQSEPQGEESPRDQGGPGIPRQPRSGTNDARRSLYRRRRPPPARTARPSNRSTKSRVRAAATGLRPRARSTAWERRGTGRRRRATWPPRSRMRGPAPAM